MTSVNQTIRNAFYDTTNISLYSVNLKRYKVVPYDMAIHRILANKGYDFHQSSFKDHPKSFKLTDFADLYYNKYKRSNPQTINKNLSELSNICTIKCITLNHIVIETHDIVNKSGINWGKLCLKIPIKNFDPRKIYGWGGNHTIKLYGNKKHPHPHIYHKNDDGLPLLCPGRWEEPMSTMMQEFDIAGAVDIALGFLTESSKGDHFFGTCDICNEPTRDFLCKECR